MFQPTIEEFRKKCREGDLIPVATEIMADLETPVSAFLKLKGQSPTFLLESVGGGPDEARYSFLGTRPRLLFRARGRRGEFLRNGAWEGTDTDDPLSLLRGEMERHRFVADERLPPFTGGAVGYLAYDGVRRFERLPDSLPDDMKLPDACFMLSDTLVAFDRVRNTITVISLAEVEDDPDEAYRKATATIDRAVDLLRSPVPRQPVTYLGGPRETPFKSTVSPEQYGEMVERAKEYIRAGDILQAVLSLRFESPLFSEPFAVYRALRVLNPSPYMFFLDYGDFQVVGSSPEMMVRKRGSEAFIRPIAGTRPRGANAAEDQNLEKELLADEKELAEHVMLVDLARNDLGRVCLPGTIEVTEYQKVERYSHVMHIVSTVRGTMPAADSAFDLVRAAFPAGTVTGAPKIRAMEIIEELEAQKRGIYAGMVGYFGYSGNFDSAIAIRTIVTTGGRAFIQAGAGIVADSVPEREYQECRHKAQALFRAVEMAQGG